MSLLSQVGRNFIRNSEKIYIKTQKVVSLNHSLFLSHRYYVQRHDYKNDNKDKFVPFDKLSVLRREEAKRSILVQVNSEESFAELQTHCLQFGEVQGVYHFVVSAGHFMLIEFVKESDVSSVLKSSNHVEGSGVPTRSPFLWFRAANNSSKNKKKPSSRDVKLLTINGLYIPKDEEINSLLQNCKNIDEQVMLLYKSTCLSDLGIRLRYFAARQVELALRGLFPNVTVRPFGSSVSGFGKQGCDLDLVLRLDNDEPKSEESRFVFHTKATLSNGRASTQKQMEVVGDLLQLFTPGCANVRRILQARVPIIKYYQEYVGLECDLSMANLTGVYMSEILYILASIDSRVCPLMFAIRKWAQSVGLTNPSPGRWITNFSLSMLVIYALQQNGKGGAVLPKVKHLVDNAAKEDFRITEDQINCTFLRDINNQIWELNNEESLHDLLLHFFEFYASFDFNANAISVIKGVPVSKPDHAPMYIVNPLEPQMNVSKNVSYEETQRFMVEVRNAAWILESVSAASRNTANKPWGLLNIFQNHQVSLKTPSFLMGGGAYNNNKPRMVDVKYLFEGDEQKSATATTTPPPREFKSQSVKLQISGIKRNVGAELKKFRSPRARRR